MAETFTLEVPLHRRQQFKDDWRIISFNKFPEQWPTVGVRYERMDTSMRVQIRVNNSDAAASIREGLFGPRGYMTVQGWELTMPAETAA